MKRNPRILYIKVSENCNSHCFMCHYAGKKNAYNITMKQYLKMIDYAKKSKITIIRFTGGEPLLHKDIINFISIAKENGLKTSIITNGYLLKLRAKSLVKSGLDQCIISLDGSTSGVHDELRNFPGCFDNIMSGISELRKYNPQIMIRVNTVVSGKNIHDISNIYKLLLELNVSQWSIIPVKYKENTWTEESMTFYNKFILDIKNNDDKRLLFLGNSKTFAGITEKEIIDTFQNNMRIKSNKKCSVVDYVRFYIPEKDLVVPCNCIAHRIDDIPVTLIGNMEKDCQNIRDWLHKNSDKCRGCEPLNAYINDNPKIMFEDEIKY